mmetsp:Transcript_7150/g.24810  ORF Transcript_7150/g.24810 Transcript_7150/m.24810 type:complete len:199 (-) Transcript_7150:34-630(-)
MEYTGVGGEQNFAAALEHYLMNKEDPHSLFNAAWLTEEGRGTARNLTRAKTLYLEAMQAARMRPRNAEYGHMKPLGVLPIQLALLRLELQQLLHLESFPLNALLESVGRQSWTWVVPFASSFDWLSSKLGLPTSSSDGFPSFKAPPAWSGESASKLKGRRQEGEEKNEEEEEEGDLTFVLFAALVGFIVGLAIAAILR